MKNIKIYLSIYLLLTTSLTFACRHDKDSVIEIETQDGLDKILKSQGAIIIQFHRKQCGWCKEMDPMIQSLSKQKRYENIGFYRANGRGLKPAKDTPSVETATIVKTTTNQDLIGYPYILFMNQGKCVDKQVGGVVRTKDQINKEISELEVLAQKIENAFPGSINKKASQENCNCQCRQ